MQNLPQEKRASNTQEKSSTESLTIIKAPHRITGADWTVVSDLMIMHGYAAFRTAPDTLVMYPADTEWGHA